MDYDNLKLKNQICFPLYACSREVVKSYKPYLDEIDLTYTKYIVMMVLWEDHDTTVKELGQRLFLDSGTLTPLLKKMEKDGLVMRKRSEEDERNLIVTITEKGEALKEKAASIPSKMMESMKLTKSEAQTLYMLLYKLLLNNE